MKAIAYAKVNLCLEVGLERDDGYHAYESLATSVGLADTLTLATTGHGERRVRTKTSTGIDDTLASRAAEAVLDAAGADVSVSIHVDKQIPPGSGLGGGSADAAASLVATAEMVGADVPLSEIAVELGTDVPFCLVGGFARLRGRGELVEPLDPLPAFGVLIAVPPVRTSTAAVFAAYDHVGAVPDPARVPAWLAELLPGCSFRNDLERAAFQVEPGLSSWKSIIEEAVGSTAFMTGSGSGFVCYAPDAAALGDAVVALHHEGIAAWATEPVPHGVRTFM